MKLDIRERQTNLSDHAIAQLERRCHSAFDRFEGDIREIRVVLSDINGPRGGEGNQCFVHVATRQGWHFTVGDVAVSAIAAADQALDRAVRTFVRRQDRARARLRAA